MNDFEQALTLLAVLRAWSYTSAAEADPGRVHPLYPANARNAQGDPSEGALWTAVNALLARHYFPLAMLDAATTTWENSP